MLLKLKSVVVTLHNCCQNSDTCWTIKMQSNFCRQLSSAFFLLLLAQACRATVPSSEEHSYYKLFDELGRVEDFRQSQLFTSVRHARSIEGAPCTKSVNNKADNSSQVHNDSCSYYPYTYCNADGQCVCNSKRAVRLELLPGYTFCLPIQYAIDTQRCLPTEPDICSLAYPGSKCTFQRNSVRGNNDGRKNSNNVVVISRRQDTSSSVEGNGEWRCQCAISGDLSSCKLFVGMSCTNNVSICTDIGRQPGQISTVECNSTAETDLYATCVCSQGTERSADHLRCMARQCPRQDQLKQQPSPCRGAAYECYSPGQPQYVSGSGRFFCACRDVGVNHSENVDGLCCPIGSLPCADFSACINQTSLCNGVKDCDDCSDEILRICARPLPKDPACVRPSVLALPPRSKFGPLSTEQTQLLSSDPMSQTITIQSISPVATVNDIVNNNLVDRRNNLMNLDERNLNARQDIHGVYGSVVNENNILSPHFNAPAQQFVRVKEVNPSS